MNKKDYEKALSGEKDLREANLMNADLRGVDLEDANLRRAYLLWVNLRGADLRGADLRRADLWGVDLQWANLRNADLREIDLRGANLKGAKGLPRDIELMDKMFKKDSDGSYWVYKSFSPRTPYKGWRPEEWKIEEGSFIEEKDIETDRREDCGSGVNFATLEWIVGQYGEENIWLCKIYREDFDQIVVPHGTDGKARCARLQLVERVDK